MRFYYDSGAGLNKVDVHSGAPTSLTTTTNVDLRSKQNSIDGCRKRRMMLREALAKHCPVLKRYVSRWPSNSDNAIERE